MRDMDFGVDGEFVLTGLRVPGSEETGKLQDHIGLVSHVTELLRRQVLAAIDDSRFDRSFVHQVKGGEARFFIGHHAPGEAIAFHRPVGVARIKVMTQGQC